MTHEERVRALTQFGFTARQASFLVLVMLHAGVCLGRQYCTHAHIVRGQKSHDFFKALVAQGFATASHAAHRGTLLYHLHGKRLYRAIGEPDDRHRRPVTLARAIERLMVLDGVLAEPETKWLATPRDKVEHFSKVTSLPPGRLPRRGASDQEGPSRAFPDALPIGCSGAGRPYVFLYLVTGDNPIDFRGFLHRHQELLRALPRWEIRLLVPDRLAASVRRFETAAIEELASPIAPSEPLDLRWYFEQQRLVNTGRASDDPARFAAMRRAFAVQRYWALYRTWKDTGDASLYEATSPLLRAAMEVEEGRVTSHVLCPTTTSVSPPSSARHDAIFREQTWERSPGRSVPPTWRSMAAILTSSRQALSTEMAALSCRCSCATAVRRRRPRTIAARNGGVSRRPGRGLDSVPGRSRRVAHTPASVLHRDKRASSL